MGASEVTAALSLAKHFVTSLNYFAKDIVELSFSFFNIVAQAVTCFSKVIIDILSSYGSVLFDSGLIREQPS